MLVPTRLTKNSPNRASDGFQVTNVLERGLGKLCSLVPQRLMFVLYFAVMLLPLPAETTGSCEVFTNLQLWTFPFITLAASLFAGFSLGFHWGWSERDFSHQFLIYGSAQEFLVALVLNVICRSMKVPCGVFWPLAMLSRTFRCFTPYPAHTQAQWCSQWDTNSCRRFPAFSLSHSWRRQRGKEK